MSRHTSLLRLGSPLLALLIACWLCPTSAFADELPHDQEWKRVLRDHLAGASAADYEVKRRPVVLDSTALSGADELYRTWLLLGEGELGAPASRGLRVPAAAFTLASIEAPGGCHMNPEAVPPHATAWWYAWDVPGNPYRGEAAVARRAFASAVVDMLMLNREHEQGRATRSDFLGGNLIWLASSFATIRGTLPEPVRRAYEAGLVRFLERLEAWGPRGVHADMDTFAVVGLWYLHRAIDDPAIGRRAEAAARRIIERHVHPAGFVDHGAGYDPSYNGVSLYYLTWAALISDWGFVKEAVVSMARLKAYTTLPEPIRGGYAGPTHFATTMSMPAVSDQSGRTCREVGMAMLTDEALYLVFHARYNQAPGWALPAPSAMHGAIRETLDRGLNPALLSEGPAPQPWKENHWSKDMGYGYDAYRPGFYERVRRLVEERSPLMMPPFRRPGDFTERFADDFVVVKRQGYGAIVHTGRLSWWEGISGLGGGALSAFWTPSGGALELGRNRLRPLPAEERDSWATWTSWQTHAVSGTTASGKAFSSARIRKLEAVEIQTEDPQRVVVKARGHIGPGYDDGTGMEPGALIGSLAYERAFGIDPDGVSVETSLSSDGKDSIATLVETIPLFTKDLDEQKDVPLLSRVWALSGEAWERLPPGEAAKTTAIRVRRHDGGLEIRWKDSRGVRLLAPPGRPCQILQIEWSPLKGKEGSVSASSSLSYRITPLPAEGG